MKIEFIYKGRSRVITVSEETSARLLKKAAADMEKMGYHRDGDIWRGPNFIGKITNQIRLGRASYGVPRKNLGRPMLVCEFWREKAAS